VAGRQTTPHRKLWLHSLPLVKRVAIIAIIGQVKEVQQSPEAASHVVNTSRTDQHPGGLHRRRHWLGLTSRTPSAQDFST